MSSAISRETPLVQVVEAPASISETGFFGYINIRADFSNKKFQAALKKICGLAPPGKNNVFVENDNFSLYWMGPDELLLLTQPDEQSAICEQLDSQSKHGIHAVTDVSSAYTMIEISGEYAPVLIAKGCPLNINPEVFSAGDCAQTLMAQAPVVIANTSGEFTYRLIVRRSFADYLMRWLIHLNNGF